MSTENSTIKGLLTVVVNDHKGVPVGFAFCVVNSAVVAFVVVGGQVFSVVEATAKIDSSGVVIGNGVSALSNGTDRLTRTRSDSTLTQ